MVRISSSKTFRVMFFYNWSMQSFSFMFVYCTNNFYFNILIFTRFLMFQLPVFALYLAVPYDIARTALVLYIMIWFRNVHLTGN